MAKVFKMNDEDVLSALRADMDKAEVIQQDLGTQRETYYSAFRGDEYGNERDGWSKTVAPTIWVQHQSAIATLIEIFSDEFFYLKGEDQMRADKFQKLIRFQMFRKQDGYRKLHDFLWNAGLYHYAVMKVTYREDYVLSDEQYDKLTAPQMEALLQDKKRQVTKYDEVTAMGETVDQTTGMQFSQPYDETSYENVKVAKKDVSYRGPFFETIPNWEFFYSPDCKLGDWGGIDGRLVYHKVKRSLNDVRRKERAGVYRKGTYSKCLELGRTGAALDMTEDERTFRFSVDEITEQDSDADIKDELGRIVTVKECYCKMDLDGDGLLEDAIVTIVEDEVVAQIERNPYGHPPFRVGGMLPEPHKINGIAPPYILDMDQKVMTNLLRFIQDTAAMSTYRNIVTNDVRMQQLMQHRKPFDCILGDPTKLGEVPVQPADPFILKAWELLKGENEEKTGMSRLNQGMERESINKTATGVSLISQASARRLRMSATLLGNGAISGLIRDFIFINQKWRTEDPIRLLGTDIQVLPYDLDGSYEIEIDIGVSPSEKQASANQMDLFIQFLTQAGLQLGLASPLHIHKALKKKYALLGINVDDCMTTEQQFMQAEQAKAQQPPKEDWREFVQIDKLFPLLTANEQAQVIMKLEIKPDPQRAVAGIPTAKDILTSRSEAQKSQADILREVLKLKADAAKSKRDIGVRGAEAAINYHAEMNKLQAQKEQGDADRTANAEKESRKADREGSER